MLSRYAIAALFMLLTLTAYLGSPLPVMAQGSVHQDAAQKTVMLADGLGHLVLRLNYDGKCILDQVRVRGRQVAAQSGVSSGVREEGQWYTTKSGIPTPQVAVGKNTLTVSNIVFGKPGDDVSETWRFVTSKDSIVWRITRSYSKESTLEDTAFPEWDFQSLSTWKGGILGNGGVVWDKYLDTPNATYGAHTGSVTFWNPEQHDCLRIVSMLPSDEHGAVRFSHQPADAGQPDGLAFDYSVSPQDLKPNHDLRRFLSDRQDLWASFPVQPSTVSAEFTLQALDYNNAFNRGVFRGVDGGSIRELLNTVGRYGVIDQNLIGANGWRSGYICLHEQWFGQIGLALGDPAYTANLASTLDYERDHAILPDGRILARWNYDAGDAMPGTFTPQGYYEAQWGYLLDSQPDYVMNVAEEYDLTGDKKWLAGQKTACEKALDYLTRREVQHTGLVTVLTDSRLQNKGSDWLDIIWASYENALINAELYHALDLWAGAEEALGDRTKAAAYRTFAARLKVSFNKPISEGGFWDPANKWYVYWRDKDGSVHGDNLVVPVSFTAIGYGLCNDPARQRAILGSIEAETSKEKLFTWPLSVFPFARDEAAGRNFPFPNYENGDIFMSWGELGVRAYAASNPALALKYVKQTLARYQVDGLSYQRYLRKTQEGAGDDILAGNCMTIVGLYRDIYGVQPKPNRLYLEPHLTSELNGTKLNYQLRGRQYTIGLSTTGCAVTAKGFTLRSAAPFGINPTATRLEYFPGRNQEWALAVGRPNAQPLTVQIQDWPGSSDAPRRWTETVSGRANKISQSVAGLMPMARYALRVNGKLTAALRADAAGRVNFASVQHESVPQTYEMQRIAPRIPRS